MLVSDWVFCLEIDEMGFTTKHWLFGLTCGLEYLMVHTQCMSNAVVELGLDPEKFEHFFRYYQNTQLLSITHQMLLNDAELGEQL